MNDPIEMFEQLDPPAGWADPIDITTDPVAARILDRVLADDGNVIDFIAARRRRRGIGGAIVVAALVAGGAVAAVWNRSPQDATRVTCWSEAVHPPAERAEARWDGAEDPVALCATKWSSGIFGVPTPDPDLEACVTADGAVAVMPGTDDVCARFGMARFSAAPGELALTVSDLQRLLDQQFSSSSCQPPSVASAETERVLREAGLTDWTITIAGASSADETCATVGLDVMTSMAIISLTARSG